MNEQEIRAEIEALGLDAAPRIARRFERLKPSPWREKFADWWCRIDWAFPAFVAVVFVLIAIFVWAVHSESAQKDEMLRVCESGDVDACEVVRRDDEATDYSRLRAERKLRELKEASDAR